MRTLRSILRCQVSYSDVLHELHSVCSFHWSLVSDQLSLFIFLLTRMGYQPAHIVSVINPECTTFLFVGRGNNTVIYNSSTSSRGAREAHPNCRKAIYAALLLYLSVSPIVCCCFNLVERGSGLERANAKLQVCCNSDNKQFTKSRQLFLLLYASTRSIRQRNYTSAIEPNLYSIYRVLLRRHRQTAMDEKSGDGDQLGFLLPSVYKSRSYWLDLYEDLKNSNANSSSGIIYSVVSPLILIFNIFAFALFYAVQRYNILNVSKSNLDTGGLVYPEALNQLFVGLYVMEIYLIGLFSLVRDGQNRAACPGQAIIMTIVALLTIVYQRIVNQGYQSHFQHLPICDAKEVNKNSAMPKFKTNSWTSDFLDKSFLINRAGGILRFFVVEDTLKMLETARISVAGQQRSSWSSRVTNIDSFNAMPEAIQKNPPTIWLPKDNLGMSTHEIHKTHQSSATISISDENAFLGPDAKVSYVDGPPAPS